MGEKERRKESHWKGLQSNNNYSVRRHKCQMILAAAVFSLRLRVCVCAVVVCLFFIYVRCYRSNCNCWQKPTFTVIRMNCDFEMASI